MLFVNILRCQTVCRAALEEGMAQKRKADAASAPPAKRKSAVARMLDDTESEDSEEPEQDL